jgi:hypothetical protein
MAAGVIESLSILNWRSSLILAFVVIVYTHYIQKKKTPSLPPGPRGLPFVGNVLDVPTTNHWLKFAELGNAWGMSTPRYTLLPSSALNIYIGDISDRLWADDGHRQLCESGGRPP